MDQQGSDKTFQRVLDDEGILPALQYLNAGVPHRYTAVYELDRRDLRCVQLYDRLGEVDASFLAVVPLQDSYCQFVLRDGGFMTPNTSNDRRLDGHPYQGVVLSYYGVPILRGQRDLFGTLCHFDVVEHHLSDERYQDLQSAAKVLAPFVTRMR